MTADRRLYQGPENPGAHLLGADPMRPVGTFPNEEISKVDLAMLQDLGYGRHSPKWWTGSKEAVVGVA
jgi:hypothetical protein